MNPVRNTENSPKLALEGLAWIGLGANLGDPEKALHSALEALMLASRVSLRACSSIYRTTPIEAVGPDYFNAVALIKTSMQPLECLQLLQDIESMHHRVRSYTNAPRTLDLDLLLWGEQTVVHTDLQIPHPRMHRRAFVLVPLAEITPWAHIPGHGQVTELLGSVSLQSVQKLPCAALSRWQSVQVASSP